MSVDVHPDDRKLAYRASGQWSQDTLADRVRVWARRAPDRLAVIDATDGRRVTFGQLCEEAERFAGALQERGVKRGDGVSVQLPNRYETVVVFVGTLMLGARLNPLLPAYREHELRHILTASQSRVYVTPRYYRSMDYVALGSSLSESIEGPPLHVVTDFGGDDVANGPTATYASLMGSRPGFDPGSPLDPSDVCELIFTSGTESTPKAVMHSEETTNFSIRSSHDHLHMDDEDVVWMPSPIGHSTGLNFGVRMSLYHGIPIVLQDVWDADHAARIIAEFRPTYTLAATTFLSDTVKSVRSSGVDASSMVRFGCGGAPVPKLVAAVATLGIGVLRLYGSTEALLVSWNQPETAKRRRLESDGRVINGVEVRVVGPDMEQLAPRESGELLVRGPNVCLGFFNDPDRTESTFDTEGWLRSGDLGILDDDYVVVVGRRKELVIRGGMNIAPREIEDVLIGMPGIADIAVTGFDDERLGEIVCAHVVSEPGREAPDLLAITQYLAERGMAKYKWPQKVVLLSELPRTSTGKVRRNELRQDLESSSERSGREREN